MVTIQYVTQHVLIVIEIMLVHIFVIYSVIIGLPSGASWNHEREITREIVKSRVFWSNHAWKSRPWNHAITLFFGWICVNLALFCVVVSQFGNHFDLDCHDYILHNNCQWKFYSNSADHVTHNQKQLRWLRSFGNHWTIEV